MAGQHCGPHVRGRPLVPKVDARTPPGGREEPPQAVRRRPSTHICYGKGSRTGLSPIPTLHTLDTKSPPAPKNPATQCLRIRCRPRGCAAPSPRAEGGRGPKRAAKRRGPPYGPAPGGFRGHPPVPPPPAAPPPPQRIARPLAESVWRPTGPSRPPPPPRRAVPTPQRPHPATAAPVQHGPSSFLRQAGPPPIHGATTSPFPLPRPNPSRMPPPRAPHNPPTGRVAPSPEIRSLPRSGPAPRPFRRPPHPRRNPRSQGFARRPPRRRWAPRWRPSRGLRRSGM